MARQRLSFLPDYDPTLDLRPFGALANYGRSQPVVGNASPAEQPGKTSEEYAQAAAAEKEAGNEDAAARLAVRSSEARAQEYAGAGAPEPTSPLPQVAPASQSKQPTLMGGEQLQAPALGEARSWGALANYEPPKRDMTDEERYGQLGEPPEYEAPNQIGNVFALGLDAFLNKGRNAGRIVSRIADGDGDSRYANWKRRADAAKAAADIEATKRRGVLTPEEQAYRDARLGIAQAQLGLREKQIDAQGDSLELRKQQEAVKNDPNHPGAVRFRKQLETEGAIQPGQWDGMTWEQMKAAGNEALKNRVDIAMAGELNAAAADKANAVANATDDNKVRVAEGIARATQPYKIELAQIQNQFKQAGEERAADRAQRFRDEDYAWKYAKEVEKDLGIARLMDDIDASGGAAPETLAERLRGSLGGWGIETPERLENWQAKKMVLELWARQQTGAAISATEDQTFAMQTGMSPTASPEQVEAAYKVLGNVVQTWLRSKGAGNPDAARTVVDSTGADSDRWLGPAQPPPATAPPRLQRKPRPRSAPAQRPATPQVSNDDLEF